MVISNYQIVCWLYVHLLTAYGRRVDRGLSNIEIARLTHDQQTTQSQITLGEREREIVVEEGYNKYTNMMLL